MDFHCLLKKKPKKQRFKVRHIMGRVMIVIGQGPVVYDLLFQYQLNLSHNELERFPPSAEMFWCGTLKYLDISHNQLDEINETVVKLCEFVIHIP